MMMRMTMTMTISSIDIEYRQFVINIFFFHEEILKHLKHKQKHLSNIQPNIFTTKQKASKLTFNQIFP